MKIWLVVKYYLMNISLKIRASVEEIWQKYVAQAFLPPPEPSAQDPPLDKVNRAQVWGGGRALDEVQPKAQV